MMAQIQLDSADLLRQLQQFIALYANVLDAQQCKALADAMQVFIKKM